MEFSFSLFWGGLQRQLVGQYHIARFWKLDRPGMIAVRPNPVTGRVSNDGQQPRSSIGSTKFPKLRPRLDVSLSNHRLRVLISSDQPACEIVRTVQVGQEKFFKKQLVLSHVG